MAPEKDPRGTAGSRVGLLLTTTLLAVALSACGSPERGAEADGTPPPTPPAPSSPSEAPSREDGGRDDPASGGEASAPVPEILDFQATTVGGDAFDGASVAGKPVVLWFWAPWCAVCQSQVPMVTGLADQYGDDLAVLGVGSLDSETAIADFADDAVGVTHLSDPDGALWKRFGIAEQSSFVVLDADGAELLRSGYDDDGAVEDAVADVAG